MTNARGKKMKAEFATFLKSWSWEISSRVNRVRSLIGDSHWASDGSHKEDLVRSFLVSRLPPDTNTCHGFLLDTRTTNCSKEIDVLVRDSRQSAPLFAESGITICHPSAALAFLEIKSGFRRDALDSALSLISDTQRLIRDSGSNQPVWRGVVFFGLEDEPELSKRRQVLVKSLKDISNSNSSDVAGSHTLLPTCVCSVGEFCAFVSPDASGKKARMKFFSAGEMSFAIAMSDLISHVFQRPPTTDHFVLDNTIEALIQGAPHIEEV
jgi:hypothetical protein